MNHALNQALLNKAWLETRWRFIIGLLLMLFSAMTTVLLWPRLMELLPLADNLHMNGEIGRRIQEAIDMSRQYHSYIWSQWFDKNLLELGTLFAVLLGTGGLLAQSSGGAALFTLSLPVSRARLLGVRTAAGLAELLALALFSSLMVPLFSPAIGKAYSLGDTLIQAGCAFIVGAMFFSLAVLLSTMFADIWRPLLFPVLIAGALALIEQLQRGPHAVGIFRVMSAEAYFKSGEVPWVGLLLSVAASTAMLYGAVVNLKRRDF
jgi:hypothetical protein